jgi:hypothetical protein
MEFNVYVLSVNFGTVLHAFVGQISTWWVMFVHFAIIMQSIMRRRKSVFAKMDGIASLIVAVDVIQAVPHARGHPPATV